MPSEKTPEHIRVTHVLPPGEIAQVDDRTMRLSMAAGHLIAAHPDEWRADPAEVLLAGRRFAVAYGIPEMIPHRNERPDGRTLPAPAMFGYTRPAWAHLIPIPAVNAENSHPVAREALAIYKARIRLGLDKLTWRGDTIVVGGYPFRLAVGLSGDDFTVSLRPEAEAAIWPTDVEPGLRPVAMIGRR